MALTTTANSYGVIYGPISEPETVVDWGGPGVGSAAGDVNGDGYDDLLFGDPGYANGETGEGRLLIFYGSPDGLDRTPGWMFESDTPDRYLGSYVTAIGDVNDDGYDDIGSSCSSYLTGTPSWISAFLGSPAGPQPAATEIVLENRDARIAGAGDVNGDSFDDLLVGDPFYRLVNPNGYGAGRAMLYLGSVDGLAATPAWTIESDRNGAGLGYSVSGADDVNGDGFDDILVGAPYYDYGIAGYVFGFLGDPRGLATTPHWVSWRRAGGNVSTAGRCERRWL